MKVLLTVDVELWPRSPGWPDHKLALTLACLDADYEQCVLGTTYSGDYGLPFILNTLRAHELKAVFFIEALHASATGIRTLANSIRLIQGAGQEVQLHVHTEWLSQIDSADLPKKHRANLGDFDLREQTAIIKQAYKNLRAAGDSSAIAFRAGNMGGNFDTPFAAHAAGLSIDLSFDPAKGAATRSTIDALRSAIGRNDACRVVPLSCVQDFPGHYRPAQLTALSFQELRHSLREAVRADWAHFVILLHSFELVKRSAVYGPLASPHSINVMRFKKLCQFLSENRADFPTAGCADILSNTIAPPRLSPVRTRAVDSLIRVGEQIASRIF